MNHMIKLIALDFNGVIVLGTYKDICRELGERYHIDPDRVYKEIYKYHDQAALNQIPEDDIFRLGLRDLGIHEDPKMVESHHYQLVAIRNEPVIAYAQELRRDGYTVIGLSKNVPKAFRETLDLSHVEKEFDAFVNTYDLGLPKGSPETVQWLMNHFHVSAPDEIIFVDDQEKNLIEAEQMGVHTHFYTAYEPMKAYIESLCKK